MDLALFDFDGTITTTDSWTPFMRLAAPLMPRLGRALAGAALVPVAVGYRAGMLSASRGRTLAARAIFAGASPDQIRRLGETYAAETIPPQVRPEVLARIESHRTRGDEVVVVSAALDVYLAPWCRAHALPVICTVLEERSGRLTGRYESGDCAGPEKARRIRARYDLARYSRVVAYGDSGEDREMLELATEKWYRGRLIADWSDVTDTAHPDARDGAA